MRTIWKHPIRSFEFTLPLSENWRVVLVETQGKDACAWIEHYPDEASVSVSFQVFRTGHSIPFSARWQGSWQDAGFVWHLYQVFA